ncbi:hypothetical protein [Actinacidiphila yeochonensis]|uniref:hypothetical protein n=1 Tax=Actinacidiphila yeochonensis TaxID=89050 RepID=UPI0012FF290D|nr:hypothetical protein [Actinacidiphila yeochonensis]
MSAETTTTQAEPSRPEPVPVEGCRICRAAGNAREAARSWGNTRNVGTYDEMIRQHPHRRATDRTAVPGE